MTEIIEIKENLEVKAEEKCDCSKEVVRTPEEIKALKTLSMEEKIKVIKEYIKNVYANDKYLAFNVYLLIKKNNNYDESFFMSDDVMFNDLCEFIDLKEEIKEDLVNFIREMNGIYISCCKYCKLVDSNKYENIGPRHFYIFCLLDFQTISELIETYGISECDRKFENAFNVIAALSSKAYFLNSFLNNVDSFGNLATSKTEQTEIK